MATENHAAIETIGFNSFSEQNSSFQVQDLDFARIALEIHCHDEE